LIRGVIFDVDGTLVGSNAAHAASWVDTLAEAGYDVPFEVVFPMIGMGGDKVLPSLSGIEESTSRGKELGRQRWEIFVRDYLPGLKPTRGARALVERLEDDGYELVIASSAGGSELNTLLEAANVADLFDLKTSSSDAEDSKPDPDIVHAAVKKIGYDPDELVMIGDTPYDVEAAIGAHVRLMAVLTGGWAREELSGAISVYEDPADILHWYDRSPEFFEFD
jgi:HAD superfamily hydrolase (TIGR01509 family)